MENQKGKKRQDEWRRMDPFIFTVFYAFFSPRYVICYGLLSAQFFIFYFLVSCPFLPFALFSRLGYGRRLQRDGKRWDGSGTNKLKDGRGVLKGKKKKGRKGERGRERKDEGYIPIYYDKTPSPHISGPLDHAQKVVKPYYTLTVHCWGPFPFFLVLFLFLSYLQSSNR